MVVEKSVLVVPVAAAAICAAVSCYRFDYTKNVYPFLVPIVQDEIL